MKFRENRVPGYERVVLGIGRSGRISGNCCDPLHSSGARRGRHTLLELQDRRRGPDRRLRLARGMTYKNALAGLPFGGGKSIIMRDGEARIGSNFFARMAGW